MRTMKGEVVLKIPAKKALEMYRNNEILGKINPDMLAGAEYLHGDGGPRSLRLFKLGSALYGYVKESTEEIESVEAGCSMAYRVVVGDLREMYDPYKVTFSFHLVPGQGGEEVCVAEWKAEFEPRSSALQGQGSGSRVP